MKKERKGVMFQSKREQVKKYVDCRSLSPEAQVLLIEKASPAELGICTRGMSSEDILVYVRSYKTSDAHLREGIKLIENATPTELIAAFGI